MVVSENASSATTGSFWRALLTQAALRFRVRRDAGPIDTVDALAGFTHTRAAFVAQKKLYGYLKARMGTRYPSMFEDDVFVQSINIAKRHVFAACLSDIIVHTVARVVTAGGLTGEAGRQLALHCQEAGLAANREDLHDEEMMAAWRAAFSARIAELHWENAAAGGDCFTESPAALYRWAPIDETLKRYDREIVENSIRFAWVEVIRDYRMRAVPSETASEFLFKTRKKEIQSRP